MKLDIACGMNRIEGAVGIDIAPLPGVDIVHDLRELPWPIESESVDEAFCSHYFEHVAARGRPGFFSEVYRILKPLAGIVVITPLDWVRQCQDFTHEWPPIFPDSYAYLDREWREAKGLVHYEEICGLACNFRLCRCHVRMGASTVSIEPSAVYQVGRQFAHIPSDLIVVLEKQPL